MEDVEHHRERVAHDIPVALLVLVHDHTGVQGDLDTIDQDAQPNVNKIEPLMRKHAEPCEHVGERHCPYRETKPRVHPKCNALAAGENGTSEEARVNCGRERESLPNEKSSALTLGNAPTAGCKPRREPVHIRDRPEPIPSAKADVSESALNPRADIASRAEPEEQEGDKPPP